MKDFFTRYRESRKHPYIIPGIFGLLFGFAIVAEMTGTPLDFRALQANVIASQEPTVTYEADLILERSGTDLLFRIGKDAQNVDTVYFTLLWDPSYFQWVSTQENGVEIITNDPGVYLIKVSLGRSIMAGEVILRLKPSLTGETSIALLDAGFQSAGTTYTLSVKN